MPKLGLALSGGGFRGTLYHLGVVRFLRDVGILSDITHITSVSGGSILAALLVLNWDRYNGSDEDFDKVAGEILDFVQRDIRNRIVRRFPFVSVAYAVRWLTRRPIDRRLTRAGLLERYYEKYLYGDTCLYELPKQPELQRSALASRPFESLGGAVVGWRIIGPEPDTTYEGHWVLD
jgi:predicted acylesterase/phospholipase RssA